MREFDAEWMGDVQRKPKLWDGLGNIVAELF